MFGGADRVVHDIHIGKEIGGTTQIGVLMSFTFDITIAQVYGHASSGGYDTRPDIKVF